MASFESRALSLLPLTPAVFHLLLALADGPLHGYAIAKAVAQHTGNDVRLGPGTLYGTLNRMAESELVREHSADDRRRVYELTPLGRAVAKAEARRMSQLVLVARGKALLNVPATDRGRRNQKRSGTPLPACWPPVIATGRTRARSSPKRSTIASRARAGPAP